MVQYVLYIVTTELETIKYVSFHCPQAVKINQV
jgi:hypothetical protein